MEKEEIEEIRKFLKDPYSRIALNWGETAAEYGLKLLSALEAAQQKLAVVEAEYKEFADGIAAQTLEEDARETALEEQLEAARAKLAEAEEKIKYESDVNAALSKQSQEYWQDRENAAKYNRELTEQLEAAREDVAGLREAVECYLGIHKEPDIPLGDAIEEAKKNKGWLHRSQAALEKMEEALARTEKKEPDSDVTIAWCGCEVTKGYRCAIHDAP